MKLIECVPNFSEGRRPEVVDAIRAAIAGVAGAHVLDTSADASHNRCVITFVAPIDAVADAAFAGIRAARELIDLTTHSGEHPRMGAADVVPFIPLEGSTMEDCIALARQLGERVGRELGIPVFLYERAATRPDRENLADVRRGEFEGRRADIGTTPQRTPDFGPSAVHPTAGAVAIGARPFLVAYNVYLGPASNLQVAKEVAKSVRGSVGGLKYVKGLGFEVDGQAQVSMNLVDTEKTPLHQAYEMVKMEAEARGVTPTWSELVGLVPERALFEAAARHIRLRNFTPEMVLERKVRTAIGGGETLSGFVGSVASPDPTPGGGSVAAHAGALAASLAQMVAGLTMGKKKYAAVDAEMRELAVRAAALGNTLAALVARDASAYAIVAAAYKLPSESEEQKREKARTVDDALMHAAEVPLETARACAEVAELALAVAERGNTNAATDAGVAAQMAQAGCVGAAWNVRINVVALSDRGRGDALSREAQALVARTGELVARVGTIVEKALA
ncbi:MAG: glutamate formiminotransferase [Gemmatimonadetes bacterium]|jgi:glutamate formiminotransferase/formiminotetrahydrofolate cyclodeaminase|nr:glutamate formiminotransferase [Gemmatimonadota bacterium]